jgi:transketolase
MAVEIRQIILEQSKRANVGHIGSALSIADIVAAIYGGVLNVDADADKVVLCKGHASLALYAALALAGVIDEEELDTFCSDDSRLGVHPEHLLPGIDFSTGSLGQGLSFAVGAALAARIQRSPRRVFAVLSDAECNEGSVWEAAMFAGQHRLANLVAIVDHNHQQALGATSGVLASDGLADRWASFGWDVLAVDGHDVDALTATLDEVAGAGDAPHVLVAETTFGKGVSFMERQLQWHYMPMSDDQYEQALAEVREAGCEAPSSAR